MIKNYVVYLEDEQVQAKLFGKIIAEEIEKYGYKLKTLNNGEDLISFLQNKNDSLGINPGEVRLILLDLAIHDISGFQILEKMKTAKSKIPVAILTAKEEKDIKQKALKLGAVDYFIKGKNEQELSRLIKFITRSIK